MVLSTLTGTQLRCLASGKCLEEVTWPQWKSVKDEGRLKFVWLFYLCFSFLVCVCLKIHLFTRFLEIYYHCFWMLLAIDIVMTCLIYRLFEHIVAEAVDSRATGLCSFLTTHSEPYVVRIDTPNWNKLICYCNERRTAVLQLQQHLLWKLAI